MTKTISVVFRILGHIWIALFMLSIVISVIGMYISEPSFDHFWRRLTSTFSPFNIANDLVMIVLLLPAIGFYKLSDYFKKKGT
jgi:hypothetical protein